MKYKIGDKVRIKTFGEIGSINTTFEYYMNTHFQRKFPDRVVEIREVHELTNTYCFKKTSWYCPEECIKEIVISSSENNIISRFEILDIR